MNQTSNHDLALSNAIYAIDGDIKQKDCRLRKQIIQDRKEKQKLAKDKEAGKILVVAGTQIIAATECKVEDQIYSVALDTCAAINAVTEEAARRMGYVRGRKDQAVEIIGHKLDLDEVIRLRIDLRNVHSDFEAHIVPSAPVDILLGQEILNRFSKGFRMMLEEFNIETKQDKEAKESVCTVVSQQKLELTSFHSR